MANLRSDPYGLDSSSSHTQTSKYNVKYLNCIEIICRNNAFDTHTIFQDPHSHPKKCEKSATAFNINIVAWRNNIMPNYCTRFVSQSHVTNARLRIIQGIGMSLQSIYPPIGEQMVQLFRWYEVEIRWNIP